MNPTTTEHKFSLDKSSKKFHCPLCTKKRFVRYINNETEEYLPEHVGKCDRSDNCNHHYSPKKFYKDNPSYFKGMNLTTWEKPIPDRTLAIVSKIDTIPYKIMEKTFSQYENNNFVFYLKSLFADDMTNSLIQQFNIGTSKAWEGANVFWQVNIKGNVRQAKVMLYNPLTGNRIKEDEEPQKGRSKIYFAGKNILREQNLTKVNLKQCFFGEHQLKDEPNKTVAIVESEKTAILMTAIQSNYIWLATGGKNGCKWTDLDVFEVLKGRKVVLFPDLGCYDDWSKKAALLKQFSFKIVVSDLLEKYATDSDKQSGFDIADYFIKRDDVFGWALAKGGYPAFWDSP